MRNRLEIKSEAKSILRSAHASPLLVTAIVLVVCYVLERIMSLIEYGTLFPDLYLLRFYLENFEYLIFRIAVVFQIKGETVAAHPFLRQSRIQNGISPCGNTQQFQLAPGAGTDQCHFFSACACKVFHAETDRFIFIRHNAGDLRISGEFSQYDHTFHDVPERGGESLPVHVECAEDGVGFGRIDMGNQRIARED